jgi:hypothetical protein
MLTTIGFDDLSVEDLWIYFNSKVSVYIDMRGIKRLRNAFFGFRSDSNLADLHIWFHFQHSKGLGYLYSLASLSVVA